MYESNQEAIQTGLEKYKIQLNPDICFITTFSHKKQLAISASPFESDSNYRSVKHQSTLWARVISQPYHSLVMRHRQFSGDLNQVTGFRRHLCSRVMQPLANSNQEQIGIDTGFINNYLNNSVNWGWPKATVLAYVRR
jgi:hypothetical protein